ncbi:unnamed protein product [Durusdinium trenchii]|uniref:Uncharacterized protein n=2 Tax=Durusdinium trenchii TaxID=1381693 RepID=A0ABP0L871_9DINO
MSDLDDDSPLSSLDSDTPKQSLPEAAEEAETGARALAPHAAPLAFEDSEDLATDLDDAAGEVPILSPSATNYVRVKLERLGEVDSFRGISMSETPPTTAEEAGAQAKVELVLRRLLAFARSPGELATFLATELHITKLKAGEAICVVGEPADSMMVLVDGYVQIYAKDIGPVGVLGPGASFGEAALLGLLHVRTATVQAVQDCAVVEIRQDILERAKFRRLKECLLLLAFERCQQSQQHQPLASLPIGVPAYASACASLVALVAERMDIPAGEAWWPVPDTHPSGPHFGVLASGLARLELSTGRYICRMKSGSYVPEGLLAKHDALLRAASSCLAYRVPQYDFILAVGSNPECRDWYDRCREHEQQIRQALSLQLRNAVKAAATSHAASRTMPTPSHPKWRRSKAPVWFLKDLPIFPVEESCRRVPRRRKVPAFRGDPREWRTSAKSLVRSQSNEIPRLDSRVPSKVRSDSQGALPIVRPGSSGRSLRFTPGLGAPGDLYHCTSRPLTR